MKKLILGKQGIGKTMFLSKKIIPTIEKFLVFDFCNELGADFSKVRLGIALDDRIGDSHTYVSSNDRGFGGYCFPKDTAAILSTSELFNVDLSVIEAAVEYNNRIRND